LFGKFEKTVARQSHKAVIRSNKRPKQA